MRSCLVLALISVARLMEAEPAAPHSFNRGRELYASGRYMEAEQVFREALEQAESVGSPDVWQAVILANVGSALMGQGKHADAELVLRRALVLFGDAGGSEPAEMLTSLTVLGGALRQQSKHGEAEALLARGIKAAEQTLGSRHLVTAGIVEGQGHLYRDEGLLRKAVDHFRRALEIREAGHGGESREVALTLGNLAMTLASEGNSAEAEPLFRRAAGLVGRFAATDPVDAANLWNDFGDFLFRLGRYA